MCYFVIIIMDDQESGLTPLFFLFSLCVGCILIAVLLTFLVFASISLTHSDNSTVYDACGGGLRTALVCDMYLGVCLIFLFCVVNFCYNDQSVSDNTSNGNRDVKRRDPCGAFISVICFLLCTVFGIITINFSVAAFSNSNCVTAMQSIDGGNDSPSYNTGSPLLGIFGVIYGVLYLSPISLMAMWYLQLSLSWLCDYE